MSVFDADGNELSAIYDAAGNRLAAAYAADGTLLFPDEATALRVMTYNVGGWYDGKGTNVPAAQFNEYYALQYGSINDNKPDILFINECWELFSDTGYTAQSFLEQFFPNVRIIPSPTSRKSFGRAICSKYPLSNYQKHIYNGETARYYDTVDASINGRTITLCVTHLGLTAEERAVQAPELLAFAEACENPIIIAGDLNTAKSLPTGDDYLNVLKPFVDAGFSIANCGDFGRIITYRDLVYGNGALDNIIFSPQFVIAGVYCDDRKYRDDLPEHVDHMPLVARAALLKE